MRYIDGTGYRIHIVYVLEQVWNVDAQITESQSNVIQVGFSPTVCLRAIFLKLSKPLCDTVINLQSCVYRKLRTANSCVYLCKMSVRSSSGVDWIVCQPIAWQICATTIRKTFFVYSSILLFWATGWIRQVNQTDGIFTTNRNWLRADQFSSPTARSKLLQI